MRKKHAGSWVRAAAAAALAAGLGTGGAAQASSVGYWQFNDGSAGANAGTLTNSGSGGAALDGTALAMNNGYTGILPSFSSNTPGLVITDGVGGAVLDANNTTSLRFTNTGVAGGNYSTSAGGAVRVNDPGGAGSLLKPASFTIEAFIQINTKINWPTYWGKARVDGNGASYTADGNGQGTASQPPANDVLRARYDEQPLGTTSGLYNQYLNSSAVLSDGNWHHIAESYDASTHTFRLYVDYVQVAQATGVTLVYDDSPLYFGNGAGGKALDGWLDEVRFSDSALSTTQLLHVAAVPEPASLAGLLLIAAPAVWRRR